MLYFNFFVLNGELLCSRRYVHVGHRNVLKEGLSISTRYKGLLHFSPSTRVTN